MAKPTLALIPSAQGSKFYSVLPSNGVGDFDFTRSGSATRINKDGLIETVSNGVSRLNYPLIDGVVNGCPSHLLETSRTNLIQYSEDLSTYVNVGSSLISNASISPNGGLNSNLLTEDSSNGIHILYTGASVSVINGLTYTFSFFAKNNGCNNITIAAGNFGDLQINSTFNLLNGTSESSNGSSYIEKIGDYYLCVATGISNATRTQNIIFYINRQNISYPFSYQGDGVSGVYLWGVQGEQGSYPTSYIPTSGSAVTRSSETANGSGDASAFNDSEGVLMAEFKSLDSSDTSSRRLGITKDGTYEGLRLQLGSGNISVTVYDGTTNQYNKTVNIDNSIFHKVALKYKTNDFALWIDGIEYFPQLSGSTFVNGTLDDISFDYVGGSPFRGSTKQIQYFDSALNDSDLETLTSWTSFTDMANGQLYSIK